MYVHIGGDYTISDRLILGIFDLDQTTENSEDTVNYLNAAEKRDLIEVVSPELPRSFIVTLERVYVSPVSVATLRKRLKDKNNELYNHL
jgi:hypothetical protein